MHAYFSFEIGEFLPEKIESQRNAQMFKDGFLRNDALGVGMLVLSFDAMSCCCI